MKNLRLWVAVAAAGVCVNQDSAAQSGDVEPTTPIVVETPTPAAGFVKPGNFLRAIPLTSLSTTRDRPLFSSSRRPPPPAVAPPPPPPVLAEPAAPPAPPPFALIGTIVGDRTRIGFFLNDQSKAVTSMREGEGDSGWTLRSVDRRSAVLENDGRMVTLDMPVVPRFGRGRRPPTRAPRRRTYSRAARPRRASRRRVCLIRAAVFLFLGGRPPNEKRPAASRRKRTGRRVAHVARANNGTAGGRPT